MVPLVVLVAVTLVAGGIGILGVCYVDTFAEATAVGLAVMLMMTASAHFVEPRRSGLIAIVPPVIRRPSWAVAATGMLEIAAAIGLLIPPDVVPVIRPAAAAGLAVMLIAMFPANVFAARERRHPAAPHTPLPLRTAIQLLFLAATLIVVMS